MRRVPAPPVSACGCAAIDGSGFHVAARINPLFPIYPDGYFAGTREFPAKVKRLRYFDWKLIDMIADAGCKTIIAGFLRLSTWNIRWIREKTGKDLTYLFDPTTKQRNTAFHFGIEEKRYYYEKIRDLCDARAWSLVCATTETSPTRHSATYGQTKMTAAMERKSEGF